MFIGRSFGDLPLPVPRDTTARIMRTHLSIRAHLCQLSIPFFQALMTCWAQRLRNRDIDDPTLWPAPRDRCLLASEVRQEQLPSAVFVDLSEAGNIQAETISTFKDSSCVS